MKVTAMPAHRTDLPLTLLRPWGLARLPGRLLAAAAMARSRRSLARLDDHLLRDIGLSRDEALAEAHRPAWDPPLHWRD